MLVTDPIPPISIDAGLAIIRQAYEGYKVTIEINPHEHFKFLIRIDGHGSVTAVDWHGAFGGCVSLLRNRIPNFLKASEVSEG